MPLYLQTKKLNFIHKIAGLLICPYFRSGVMVQIYISIFWEGDTARAPVMFKYNNNI
jgi:hypothetical protein